MNTPVTFVADTPSIPRVDPANRLPPVAAPSKDRDRRAQRRRPDKKKKPEKAPDDRPSRDSRGKKVDIRA